jgi:outer membrane protein
MHKLLAIFAATLFPSLSSADALGLYGGVGQWYVKMEGDVGQQGVNTSLDSLGVDDETSNVLWLMFEHPLPFIPNVRLMHSEISTVANSQATQVILIGNLQIQVQAQIQTTIDISHTDATFYYQLLDNWLTLDLGVTARQMSGYVEVVPEVGGRFRAEMDGVVPTGYINLQIDFPYSGWHMGATVNAAAYKGDKITDVSGRIGYEFEITPAMDLGLNVGYRNMDLLVNDLNSLNADASLSGAFFELLIHF